MKILIALNHPAHYYLFKYTVANFNELGFKTVYVIKEKDILEKLLISEKADYVKICVKRKRKNSLVSILYKGFIELVIQDFNLLKFVKIWKPNIMIGTDFSITHVGTILGIPSLVFNEDDYQINKFFCNASYPFATRIVSPECCSVGRYKAKKLAYDGFQKMAYLHPKHFSPDFNIIKDYISSNEKYFIIRLVSLTAGHDIEGKHSGLKMEVLDDIIHFLNSRGRIFVSSESPLSKKYEKYKVCIPLNVMHHFMAFSTLFIGDSQTMCAEAGLLGTPFIRFNDFIGKISYLNELENKYSLGFGVTTNQPDTLLQKIEEVLSIPNMKEEWSKRKNKVFQEKIDVTQWYTKLITNFIYEKNEN